MGIIFPEGPSKVPPLSLTSQHKSTSSVTKSKKVNAPVSFFCAKCNKKVTLEFQCLFAHKNTTFSSIFKQQQQANTGISVCKFKRKNANFYVKLTTVVEK